MAMNVWTKLSTTVFKDGAKVTKRFLNKSDGGILKTVEFPENSVFSKMGIRSTSLYSYRGEPLQLTFTEGGQQITKDYREAIEYLKNKVNIYKHS